MLISIVPLQSYVDHGDVAKVSHHPLCMLLTIMVITIRQYSYFELIFTEFRHEGHRSDKVVRIIAEKTMNKSENGEEI